MNLDVVTYRLLHLENHSKSHCSHQVDEVAIVLLRREPILLLLALQQELMYDCNQARVIDENPWLRIYLCIFKYHR